MAGDMDRIDILLAAYDGARFLPDLLASLERQSWPDWRLVARDDGSADGTPTILSAWMAARTGREHLLLDGGGRRLGACGNFNALLTTSTAPYFMFCDQDDVWLPQKMACLHEVMRRLEDEAGSDTPLLVHSDLAVVDAGLSPIAGSYWRQQRLAPDRAVGTGSLIIRNVVTGCAMMGNAALRRAALPFPSEAFMHDWWCALVAWRTGRIGTCAEPTVLYRQHATNTLGFGGGASLPGMIRRIAAGNGITGQMRPSIRSRAGQARALLARFPGNPDMPQSLLCRAVANLPGHPFLARKRFLRQHGIATGSRLFDLAFSVLA